MSRLFNVPLKEKARKNIYFSILSIAAAHASLALFFSASYISFNDYNKSLKKGIQHGISDAKQHKHPAYKHYDSYDDVPSALIYADSIIAGLVMSVAVFFLNLSIFSLAKKENINFFLIYLSSGFFSLGTAFFAAFIDLPNVRGAYTHEKGYDYGYQSTCDKSEKDCYNDLGNPYAQLVDTPFKSFYVTVDLLLIASQIMAITASVIAGKKANNKDTRQEDGSRSEEEMAIYRRNGPQQ